MQAEHLYIHVPFCARRCVYCDFSIAVRSRIPVAEYVAAIQREWELRHGGTRFDLSTLYFGGGTPSKLGGDGVARLLDVCSTRASIMDDAEVTLEANPEDVDPATVRAWRSAGVNRVSLGVQSFSDPMLTWMHRTHDASAARRAIDALRDNGIENVSIDLIFATPVGIDRSWQQDVEIALAMRLDHLSVYGLTIEPQTPVGRWVARHDIDEAPEERFEQEFLEADSMITAAGLEHYEVSNYGKPGTHSRHNWAYWKRKSYGGLGPSAHEFDGERRRWNLAPYAQWLSVVSGGENPTEGTECLDGSQQLAEETYLGLRTGEGLLASDADRAHIAPWVAAGWAHLGDDSRVRLTPLGWLRLDALASDLTHFRSRY